MYPQTPTNEAIAAALERLAAALAERGSNPHRVQAYLTAADTLRATPQPVAALLAEAGERALTALPGIGDGIAGRIAGFVETGELRDLRLLRAEARPEDLFTRVAGVGPELARRVHAALGVETLEALEAAAHDGRLATVEGFGPRRVEAVRQALGALLGRTLRRRLRRERRAVLGDPDAGEPPLALLLSVDAAYRSGAAAGTLPCVAPSRFNPTGAAWLPVLHVRHEVWAFTALFSNSARAHEAGKTDDWVVLYHERDGREGQSTVVTETRGDLQGLRVVRGREAACRVHYAARPRAA